MDESVYGEAFGMRRENFNCVDEPDMVVGLLSKPKNGQIFRGKDPDAFLSTQWSIQDRGSYMLYYYRVLRPGGWPESEIDIDKPEFEPRPWVERTKAKITNDVDELALAPKTQKSTTSGSASASNSFSSNIDTPSLPSSTRRAKRMSAGLRGPRQKRSRTEEIDDSQRSQGTD